MKVRAKHWLKYDGVWHKGGETFEIPTTDAKELEGMIEIAETPVLEPELKVEAEETAEAPKKRGRKPKTGE